MGYIRDATVEEMFGELISLRSVPRLCNEEQLRLRDSFETAVRRVGIWCEMTASLGESALQGSEALVGKFVS
jgi:hypothetical protein